MALRAKQIPLFRSFLCSSQSSQNVLHFLGKTEIVIQSESAYDLVKELNTH